ncbi:MAG: pentapeptide repeat-containing protein [Anaerolineae bacterium]|nr:pentapeptide repeat-containing protein [Anaerolineae bacterium]
MADEDQLGILKQGVEVWNEWRIRNHTTYVDLYDADLSGSDLSGSDLSGSDLGNANLSEANLRGANLSRAILRGVSLSRADLSGANLSEAILRRANLSRADLSEANLLRANLNDANLSEANLNDANLSNANLSDANLSGADLSDADLSSTSLNSADLSEANLSRANLSKASLSKADLSGASLSKADLSGAHLYGVTIDETCQMDAKWRLVWQIINGTSDKSTLSGADLSRADLGGANLSDAFLNKANLTKANLSNADLSGADLRNADLSGADLRNADLSNADLRNTDLSNADLRSANLWNTLLNTANLRDVTMDETSQIDAKWRLVWHLVNGTANKSILSGADLSGADLSGADLSGADLSGADLSGADLSGADLRRTILVSSNFTRANLSECRIYGISAWNVKLQGAIQTNLDISDSDSALTVDNLEVAQFIYMLIHNEKIRDIIQTIGNKAVLILGRFADEQRKTTLDALREKLRQERLLPIIFDFEKATNVDFIETVKILAGMCLFIIADVTAPKSTPMELQATVPDYMVPFVPIIQKGEQPFSMFQSLQGKYHWVMDVLAYETTEQLIEYLPSKIIKPAIEKHNELIALKNQELRYSDISAE